MPGVQPNQWGKLKALSDSHEELYYSVGVHPWYIFDSVALVHRELSIDDSAKNYPQQHSSQEEVLDRLALTLSNCLQQDKCVAIGECGLDFAIDTPLDEQLSILELHLNLAKKFSKPLILHSVRAHAKLSELLKAQQLPEGGVIHGFSGSYEQAKTFWDLGFKLGVGRFAFFGLNAGKYSKLQNKTRDAIARLPIEALVVESDAPWKASAKGVPSIGGSEYVVEACAKLAELRGDIVENVSESLYQNTLKLYKIKP
jgi:TatD DNase family protein